MADEVKAKRPVPPQFLRKKKEAEQLPLPPEEIIVPELARQIDVSTLVKDLMFNRYFHIMEKEAKPIAERMVNEGSETLHEVKWFLAPFERVQLAKDLKEKHGLLK